MSRSQPKPSPITRATVKLRRALANIPSEGKKFGTHGGTPTDSKTLISALGKLKWALGWKKKSADQIALIERATQEISCLKKHEQQAQNPHQETLLEQKRSALNNLIQSSSTSAPLKQALTSFQRALAWNKQNREDRELIHDAQYKITSLEHHEKDSDATRPHGNEGSAAESDEESDDDFSIESCETVDFTPDLPVLFYPKTWRSIGITGITVGSTVGAGALFFLSLAAADLIAQPLNLITQFTMETVTNALGFGTTEGAVIIASIAFIVAAIMIAYGAKKLSQSNQTKPAVAQLSKRMKELLSETKESKLKIAEQETEIAKLIEKARKLLEEPAATGQRAPQARTPRHRSNSLSSSSAASTDGSLYGDESDNSPTGTWPGSS